MLTKQDAIKPVEDFDCYCCPRCEFQLEFGQNYCDDCGQKLNWTNIKINYDGSAINDNVNLFVR